MKAITNSATCPKCGGGHKSKPFCIYENGWWCFACGYVKASDRAFSIYPKMSSKLNNYPEITLNINEYSLDALTYLTQYNITTDDIYKHKIGFRKAFNSLVFPITYDNKVVGWQERSLNKRFITGEGTKIPSLFKEHDNKTVVLVEDYLSAIRVSKQYNTVCLWGVKISHEYLSQLFRKFDVIITWLDNDKEKDINSGQVAASVIKDQAKYCIMQHQRKRSFSVNCKEIVNVLTNDDPKYYTDTEIREIIQGTLNAK